LAERGGIIVGNLCKKFFWLCFIHRRKSCLLKGLLTVFDSQKNWAKSKKKIPFTPCTSTYIPTINIIASREVHLLHLISLLHRWVSPKVHSLHWVHTWYFLFCELTAWVPYLCTHSEFEKMHSSFYPPYIKCLSVVPIHCSLC
jgi:hypothetical protein